MLLVSCTHNKSTRLHHVSHLCYQSQSQHLKCRCHLLTPAFPSLLMPPNMTVAQFPPALCWPTLTQAQTGPVRKSHSSCLIWWSFHNTCPSWCHRSSGQNLSVVNLYQLLALWSYFLLHKMNDVNSSSKSPFYNYNQVHCSKFTGKCEQ